ncbi:MAG TPA: hypothetical protein VK797_15940 [Tepidisphaeraceae bacterium]|nr:hypothetical protein [Tepidisphaeraceae bacterium]
MFHHETKDWLAGLDWPPTADEDFDQISKFEITGQTRPTTEPTTKPA